MTNQNNENQLRKAFEDGDLISVGQKSISKEKKEELLPIESKFNQTFFKYNLPIGIDFGKSLKPNNFLTSLEILDKTLQITKISEGNRFRLENLRLFLTTGKIWHYKQELNSFLKEEEEKEEKEEKEINETYEKNDETSEKQFISLLISLNFILNQASTTNINWVSQNQILEYVDSQDQRNILREWKSKNYGKLPEDAVFLSLISQTLIHQISLLNLPLDEKIKLNELIDLDNLKNLAISAKFSEIHQITTDKIDKLKKLKKITPNYLPSKNLTDDSIKAEKSSQIHPDFNNVILYRILDTLNILQNE